MNKITIKENYPLFHVSNLLDRLNGAKYFSWVDLKSKYYKIHSVNVNVEKMVKWIKYSSYEFLVMSFGLCNALSTFIGLKHDGVPPLKHRDSFLGFPNSLFCYFSHDMFYISPFLFMLNEIILFQILRRLLKYLFFSLMKVKIIKFIQCGPHSINGPKFLKF